MHRIHRFTGYVLIVALVASLAAGCGVLPTTPVTTSPAATGPVTAGQTQQVAGTNSLLGGVVGGLVSLVDWTVQFVFKFLNIVGSLGGSLSNGRWTVTLPPNAISGTATIGVGVQSATGSACQLSITPAVQNHFAVPATLTVDCSGVPADQLRNYVIFLYDPTTGQWNPVAGSTVDLTHMTVSAPLQHFSTYAVGPSSGRASW